MQITQLKLEQEVEINGHEYHYKGIQKKKIENFGVTECFVFYCKKIDHEKVFQLHGSKLTLKEKDGKLTL